MNSVSKPRNIHPSNLLDVPSPYLSSSRSSPAASPSSRKRSRTLLGETTIPEDNDSHTKRRCSDGGAIITDSPPLLACPYSKYDPVRYSPQNIEEPQYRGCSGSFLRDIPRLKQHLYRVHAQPDHYCPCCFESFGEESALHNHMRLRDCINRRCPFPEMMTFDQKQAIKKRFPKKDPAECWYMIYKSLFPESALPKSPFAEFLHPKTITIDQDVQDLIMKEIPGRLAQELAFQMQYRPQITGDYHSMTLSLTTSIKSMLQSILNEASAKDVTHSYHEPPLSRPPSSYDDSHSPVQFGMGKLSPSPLSTITSEPETLHGSFYQNALSLNLVSTPVQISNADTSLPNTDEQINNHCSTDSAQGSYVGSIAGMSCGITEQKQLVGFVPALPYDTAAFQIGLDSLDFDNLSFPFS